MGILLNFWLESNIITKKVSTDTNIFKKYIGNMASGAMMNAQSASVQCSRRISRTMDADAISVCHTGNIVIGLRPHHERIAAAEVPGDTVFEQDIVYFSLI